MATIKTGDITEEPRKPTEQPSDNYRKTLWNSQFYFQKENHCVSCNRLQSCKMWQHTSMSCASFVG